MLQTAPAVFAVGHEYQIMMPVEKTAMVWVQIKDEVFPDESNGIMRSLDRIHRISVPMEKLDAAGEYTVFLRPVSERKPYFTATEPPVSVTYPFYPVPQDTIRIFHIADAHGRITGPVQAAQNFGKIDLLILNGDILDHSDDPADFLNIYEICSRICRGSRPVVFSRGNHDLRGRYAEKFADYTPNDHGQTYYSFRAGPLWGLVLDCGEDKNDDRPEYGFTAACHPFRKKETGFLERIISDRENEFAAEGVKHRLVISHIPFTRIDRPPFDIEQEIYRSWVEKLRLHIRPELMLCGHTHELKIIMPGDELDHFGQPCPVITGSKPAEDSYTATGLVLTDTENEIYFADDAGNLNKYFTQSRKKPPVE